MTKEERVLPPAANTTGKKARWIAAASALLLAGLLLLLWAPFAAPQSETQPQSEHVVYAPYWTVERGFSATLYIRNHHVSQALSAQPILYSPEGEQIALETVDLQPRATVATDLKRALQSAGRSALTHGAVAIRYTSPYATNLGAAVVLLNQDDTLSFRFPLLGAYLGSASQTLESTWWFHDENTRGELVLFNKSASAITVKPTFYLPTGLDFESEALELAPFTQATLDLRKHLRDFGLEQEPMGGIQLQYTGEQHGLLATALFSNDETGYSNQSRFVGHDVLHQETWQEFTEPGQHTLRAFATLGQPAPGSGFPDHLLFRPKVLLRNATDEKVLADLRFTYMADGQPASVSLPLRSLLPQETRLVDVYDFVEDGILPEEVSDGVVTLTYTGFPNDVLMSLASLDQSGNWVLPGQTFPSPSGVFQGVHWRAEGEWNTVVRVQNVGADAVKLELGLDSLQGSGQYLVRDVELAPQAVYLYDLKEILRRSQPDAEGNVLPSGVTSGGLRVAGVESESPARLIAETSVFNGARGTCFGGTGCCGFVDTWPDPTSIVATSGDVDLLKWFGLRCDNNVEVITNFGLFSSSNSSVISVQNGTPPHGQATCNAPGTATIHVHGQMEAGNSPFFDFCPNNDFENDIPGTVKPTITVTCDNQHLALGPTAPFTTKVGTCSTTAVPAGGTYAWSATKNTVTINAAGGAADYTAANPSTSNGDTKIKVRYTVNGQFAEVFSTPITVHKPTSLLAVSDTGSVVDFDCVAQFGGPDLCGVRRDIRYQVFSQLNAAIPIAGLPAVESFQLISDTCMVGLPTPMPGVTLADGKFSNDDRLALCSGECLPADANRKPTGSCTLFFQQTWSVAGLTVRTNSITMTCTQVSVVPQ